MAKHGRSLALSLRTRYFFFFQYLLADIVPDPFFSTKIMDIVQQAASYKMLKKGANEGEYAKFIEHA
jgi:hypothetical protein